jgi:hypothetical protein
MATELSKEAFTQLLLEALPDAIQSLLGVDIPGIQQQFSIVNTVAADAAQARLGQLLGVQGKELIEASKKLTDYYAGLAPHERSKYENDSAVIDLYQSMSSQSTTPSPDSGVEGFTSRRFKQSEIEEMDLEEFRNLEDDIEQAFLEGRVELDVE